MLVIFAATLLGLAGSVTFYLSWPGERRAKDAAPKPAGLALSGIAIAASILVFAEAVSTLSSVFIVFLIVMIVWTGLPFLNQLVKGGNKNG